MPALTGFHMEIDRRLIWLSGRVLALGDFATGQLELGLHFIGEFKLVFQEIINPRADFFNLRARKLWQDRFNFLDRAHDYQDSVPRINGNSAIFALVEDVAPEAPIVTLSAANSDSSNPCRVSSFFA
jgi:hypothetical protein